MATSAEHDAAPELRSGTAAALASAFLFGVSTPAAKALLPETEPLVLGGLLYLGAGLGLTVVRGARSKPSGEAPLRRSDLPVLLGMVVAGAIVAPLLLLIGLQRVSAVTGSLLLNLEVPLTVLPTSLAILRANRTRTSMCMRRWTTTTRTPKILTIATTELAS